MLSVGIPINSLKLNSNPLCVFFPLPVSASAIERQRGDAEDALRFLVYVFPCVWLVVRMWYRSKGEAKAPNYHTHRTNKVVFCFVSLESPIKILEAKSKSVMFIFPDLPSAVESQRVEAMPRV